MKAEALCLTRGVTDDNIFSMCIANHLKKRYNISMDTKEYPHNRWSLHLAYKVLRTVSKFPCVENLDTSYGNNIQHLINIQMNRFNNEEDENGIDSGEESERVDESQQSNPNEEELLAYVTPNMEETMTSTSANKKKINGSLGGHCGNKKAKTDAMKIRHSGMAITNSHSLAESLKRRTDPIEERNAMDAFAVS